MRNGNSAPLSRHRTSLPALTGIRFFAAMYVVLFHFGAGFAARHHAPPPIENLLQHGYVAVSLFFLLSGFILAYTYEGQIDGSNGRWRFWEARFARIYPVYLLSLIVAIDTSAPVGIGTRLACLTMIQAWNPALPHLAGAWNMPAWTLSVEAFFYLCFPFVQPWIARLSMTGLRTAATIFCVAAVLSQAFFPQTGESLIASGVNRFLPLPLLRLPEFLLGITLGMTFLRSGGHVRAKQVNWRIYGALPLAMLLLCLPMGHWISLTVPVFAILLYELARGTSRPALWLSTPIMALLGGASYSIYLLQLPVRYWAHVLFLHFPARFQSLDQFASPVVLIALAIFIYRFWEEPCRRALRSWFAARKRSPSDVAAAQP